MGHRTGSAPDARRHSRNSAFGRRNWSARLTLPPTDEKSAAERRDTSRPASGSRPEGARDEREAGARVREMFGHIAPRYDFLNHFLSLSFDRLWRRRTAKGFSAILA